MKILLKTLGFIVLILVITVAVLLIIPDTQYKRLAEYVIHKSTQREVSIGELTTRRNLAPSVIIKNLTIGNPDGFKDSTMVSAKEINASIDLTEIFNGTADLHFTSDALHISLQRDTNGKTNWTFSNQPPQRTTETQASDPTFKNLARFVLKNLDIKNFKLDFDDQQAGRTHQFQIASMHVVETENGIKQNVNITGSIDSLPFTITGNAGQLPALKNQGQLPLDFVAKLADVELTIKGTVNNDANDLNLDSDVNFSMPSFNVINEFIENDLPVDWMSVTAQAQLNSKSGKFSLSELDMSAKGNLKARVTGTVTDLSQLSGINLDATAELASISSISAFTGQPLPDLGPINFSGNIASEDNTIRLKDGQLSHDSEYGQAKLEGTIGDLIHFSQVNLNADIDLPNLNIAALFTDAHIPQTGNIKLAGRVISTGERDLTAQNLTLDYDHQGLKLKGTGDITSLISKGGELNLGLDANIASLDALNTLADAELPALGPIDLHGKISGSFTDIKLHQLIAEFNDAALTGNIEADIGSLNQLDQLSAAIDISTPSTGELLSKLGLQSSATAAGKLTANLVNKNKSITLKDFVLKIDHGEINAALDMTNFLDQSARSKLAGTVTVSQFNLNDLLGAPVETQQTDTGEAPAGFSIPDSPLPLDWLRDNDLDVNLAVERFDSNLVVIRDTNINLVAQDGRLDIEPFKSNINNGEANFGAYVDASGNPAQINVNTSIEGFSFKNAGTFDDSEIFDTDGSADARLELSGAGNSIAAILASSKGAGVVDIKNLTIKNDLIKFVSGDLVKEAASKLNPLKEQTQTTRIDCAAIKLDVTDGLMSTPNGYLVDSKAFSISGKAKVNFVNQHLDIEFNTNPKEGLGLGLGELARAVKVTGTIDQPKIGLNASGVAEIGATVGAAVATGGVSLLAQGQLEKIKANAESCEKVLQKNQGASE